MKNKIQKQRGKRLVMGKASWKALVISLDKLSLVPYKEHCICNQDDTEDTDPHSVLDMHMTGHILLHLSVIE